MQRPGDCYYEINDVTVGRISFSFAYVRQNYSRAWNVFVLVEMHLFLNFNILETGLCSTLLTHYSKLNFYSKIWIIWNFTVQINAYQEGTKVNIEVNVRVLKNLGTFILEYKAPLILIIGTHFLQPSALYSHYAGGNAAIYTVRLSVECPQLKNVRTMVTCATTKGTARWWKSWSSVPSLKAVFS